MSTNHSYWLRYLPAVLRAKIEHRHNLQKALTNTGWLFADSIIRMGMGLLVGVWVARYLGPEQYGLLNFATAFVTLFAAVAALGLKSVVVRDLLKQPESTNQILGTAFVLQLIGGLLAFGLVILAIGFARPNDALVKSMVVVLGFTMLFTASDTVKCWFESQVQSKYAVLAENSAFLISAAAKVLLIINQAPLMAFVWFLLAEAVIASVLLLVMYAWRGGNFRNWKMQQQFAKNLLKESWPLILSGLAVIFYMRIDQIMLGQMVGGEAVGIYSAAVRISQVWYFVPMAIVASVFPSIIEAKKRSEALYLQRLQRLFDLMVILAIVVAVPTTFLSNWVVTLLFGQAYQQAGDVLSIHIWTGVLVFLGIANSRYLLIQGYMKMTFFFTASCGIANVMLNLLLIPKYGVVGAAMATLLAQCIGLLLLSVNTRTRVVFYMQIKALLMLNMLRGNFS